ncbi:hypothetical protein [Persicobacter sp. CCB-QB2]|uniref:hypothetical protein n=1 Tax=Persicobacter sp. CCB-QB2 TaxID=1561025 RepID=UPI0006A95EA7|nr:hypothetical protein [Persicobacter sp. CCB-QB2]
MRKVEIILTVLLVIFFFGYLFLLPGGSIFLSMVIGILACFYLLGGGAISISGGSVTSFLSQKNRNADRPTFLLLVMGVVFSIGLVGIQFIVLSYPGGRFIGIVGLALLSGISLISLLLWSREKQGLFLNILKRSIPLMLLIILLNLLPAGSIERFRFRNYPEYLEVLKDFQENPTNENYDLLKEKRKRLK